MLWYLYSYIVIAWSCDGYVDEGFVRRHIALISFNQPVERQFTRFFRTIVHKGTTGRKGEGRVVE